MKAMLQEDDVLAAIVNDPDAEDALRLIVRLVIRQVALLTNAAAPADDVLTIGGLTIDRLRHTVSVDGTARELKPREYALLETLARRPGIVFTRERLLDLGFGDQWNRELS
jgi:DNA-binding response OmpR family regulator